MYYIGFNKGVSGLIGLWSKYPARMVSWETPIAEKKLGGCSVLDIDKIEQLLHAKGVRHRNAFIFLADFYSGSGSVGDALNFGMLYHWASRQVGTERVKIVGKDSWKAFLTGKGYNKTDAGVKSYCEKVYGSEGGGSVSVLLAMVGYELVSGYEDKDKDKGKVWRKQYYQIHRNKILSKQREKYNLKHDEVLEYHRKYRARNRDKVLGYSQAYRSAIKNNKKT